MDILKNWTVVLIGLLFIITLFVALRFFVLWYWRVNKIVDELEAIKDYSHAQTKLLKLISYKLGKNELDQAEGISIKDHRDIKQGK